ncbi:MAG: hypothetical protein KJ578_00135 [Bacteroidetes bacterium]|nr:hypothetical protein [Bacteroidota bacterium]MBU1578631.1 hypothetical protein [Bacteroidota bacterium]MBU2556167.1 hypothetical protein [Bacteroidota bacterium]
MYQHNAASKSPKLNLKPLDFRWLMYYLSPQTKTSNPMLVQWHIWITLSKQLNKLKPDFLHKLYRFVLQLATTNPSKESTHLFDISGRQCKGMVLPCTHAITCLISLKHTTYAYINHANRTIFKLGKNNFISQQTPSRVAGLDAGRDNAIFFNYLFPSFI